MSDKVTALLNIRLWVDCPKCEELIDLFELDYINDEGSLWNAIRSIRGENLGIEFECPKCKVELTFDKLEY